MNTDKLLFEKQYAKSTVCNGALGSALQSNITGVTCTALYATRDQYVKQIRSVNKYRSTFKQNKK